MVSNLSAPYLANACCGSEVDIRAYRADVRIGHHSDLLSWVPRSPASTRGRSIRKISSDASMIAAINPKAADHAEALPPAKSRTHPTTSGPIKPPAYPSDECIASVAPRREGSAVPAVPAVSDAESSQITAP